MVTLKALHPDLLNDFLYFFEKLAFPDNPAWASCYCYYFHTAGNDQEWAKRTGEENRAGARDLILAGKMGGYLAYSGGSPVGWCNANGKTTYARLAADENLEGDPKEKVGSIVCFIIAPRHRRKGVAGELLEGACAGFGDKNYDWVEGYPRKRASSDARHYHGPLSMFESAGFKIYREFPEFFVVRKEI